ncbi:MoaD/ThiS family protein [Candidatus Thorarchaeota archaeon]|nr:MAG: MoaD/ThiS family protein [Candidatus Thorarchaeota archaeon]
MMKVSVKFYAHLGDLVGKKSKMEIELQEHATVSHLLDVLLLDSKIKEHILDVNEDIKSDITIMRNGREIKFLEGLSTVLHPDDEIQIFPVVAGGSALKLETELLIVDEALESDYNAKIHVRRVVESLRGCTQQK